MSLHRAFSFVIPTLASAVALAALGCASNGDAPVDAVESSDDAISTAIGENRTVTYEGSFVANGESFDVEVTVSLPERGIGYQQADSAKWHTDPYGSCRVFNEWTGGTLRLRVIGADGDVVADRTAATGTNGIERLDTCEDGFLVNPRVYEELPATIDADGLELTAGGKTVHVPAGYVHPGFVSIDATSRFEPLSEPTFRRWTDGGYNQSEFKVERGVISIELPATTTMRIGIQPSFSSASSYEEIAEVTLRAR